MNIIEMNHISKYFGVNDTQALTDMNLSVKKGEIHAIVGENGAGKSTLMKILHKIEKPDSGSISIKGNTGMVSQHFRLVDSLSILDNIIIGGEPKKYGFIIDRTTARKKINNILNLYGFNMDIETLVYKLSIGQKQLVEIIKVIYDNSEILIFDEPTSTLSDIEADKLRETLLSLKKHGKTIIIISHKIKDISSISDRFTIMRKGYYIETVTTELVNIEQISRLMSGTDIIKAIIETDNEPGKILFSLKNEYIDIKLHEQEIVGITGYGDCGLHQLEEELEKLSIKNNKIGYVPSDRLRKGVELNSKLKESLIAAKRKSFAKFGILNEKLINDFSQGLIKNFNIKGNLNSQTGTLSGGNLQKSVLARVLDYDPETLFLCAPTWGIDIESSNKIYLQIRELKNRNRGILLLSSDAEEILKLSNRILVMYKGKVIKEIKNNDKATLEYLGRLSAGILND